MRKGNNIVIIDNNDIDLFVYSYFIENELKNYKVFIAFSGAEGVRLLLHTDFHLCIMNVNLPFNDGLFVYEIIKVIRPLLRVCFLSARNSESDKQRAMDLGAVDYLIKCDPESIALRVRNILGLKNDQ